MALIGLLFLVIMTSAIPSAIVEDDQGPPAG